MLKKIKRQNKKGLMGIILFFVALLLILVIAFIGAITVGVVKWGSNIVTPITQELGTAGDANISQAADYTFVPLNRTINAFPWVLGFLFVCALLFSIGFATSMTVSPNPFLLGFYFMAMILLIFGAIVMSNMYEEIYNSNDELGTALQEQTLTSYMILYSPFILTLIAVIAGVYMFTRTGESQGGMGI